MMLRLDRSRVGPVLPGCSIDPPRAGTAMPALRRSLLAALLVAAAPASGQLPEGNAIGVSTGHVHFMVPDAEKHLAIWESLGGRRGATGPLDYVTFPGIHVLVTQGEAEAASIETAANHVGFAVQDYARYKALLQEAGASFFFDSEENGQILADLPDGVRVEILVEEGLSAPIVFHHLHLASTDGAGLRDWYMRVFEAEAGERRGLPSALLPGGRVDFLPAPGGNAPRPSRGSAFDHIGFEVADMEAFAARMQDLEIEFDIAPRRIEAAGLSIAFITDPAGTFIEITEGLADLGRE
jgi:catechol 2,3-dioxygenase-like lactoylglutathione lyase family enzyme